NLPGACSLFSGSQGKDGTSMRRLLVLILLCGLVSFGCTTSTKKTEPKKGGDTGKAAAGKGEIVLEAVAIEVEPEKDADATVKVNRKGGYTGPVDVEFAAIDGIVIEPAKVTLKDTESEAKVKVKASKDAKPGKVKVTGKGKDVTGTADLEVKV